MKKIMSFLLTVLILLSCTVSAFGAPSVTVAADAAPVLLSQNSETTIPVRIENNLGIMGFKITVVYPVDKIKVTSVSKGDVTKLGNFNTNFGINDGKFDVLWNNTEEVADNGILFFITAKSVSETAENAEIQLTYSQPDTFNEEFNDVVLDCQNIAVRFSASDLNTGSETTVVNSESSQITYKNEDVLSIVQETLKEYDYDNLLDVPADEQTAFLDSVNQKLSSKANGNYIPIDNFQSMVSLYYSAYEDFYISDVISKVPNENIQQAINDALNSAGVTSIADLQEEQKEEFVKALSDNLQRYNGDIAPFPEELDPDKAVDIVQNLKNAAQSNLSPVEAVENHSSPNNAWIILAVALVVIILSVIGIWLRKKKKEIIKRMHLKNKNHSFDVLSALKNFEFFSI